MAASRLDIPAYLRRLGLARRPPPTLATLRELQLRHTSSIAFETISTLLHAPVPIDPASLQRKVLEEGRGGYCYELNMLFLTLLREIGFDARGLAGRVVMGGPEDAVTARTHMLVLVTVEGHRHVADVGFGGMVPTAPLLLDEAGAQATPHESYRIDRREGDYLLRAQVGGEWRALYAFDLQPQALVDYEVGNWYVSTHPDSVFAGQLVAARTGDGWRRTLRGGDFAVHRTGVGTRRTRLDDADSVIAALDAQFDIRVPPGPGLHDAIERLLREDRAGK